MSTTRRFVALPVEPHVVAALDAALVPVRAAVPDLRWTDPEGWHVTLAFVGALRDDLAARLVDAVREVVGAAPPPQLQLAGPTVFRDTVLVAAAADVGGSATTPDLAARLQEAIGAAGLPVERRPLRAHVTLARGRRGQLEERVVAGTAVAIEVAASRVPLAWSPLAAELWCSAGRSHGRGYAVEASVPFGG